MGYSLSRTTHASASCRRAQTRLHTQPCDFFYLLLLAPFDTCSNNANTQSPGSGMCLNMAGWPLTLTGPVPWNHRFPPVPQAQAQWRSGAALPAGNGEQLVPLLLPVHCPTVGFIGSRVSEAWLAACLWLVAARQLYCIAALVLIAGMYCSVLPCRTPPWACPRSFSRRQLGLGQLPATPCLAGGSPLPQPMPRTTELFHMMVPFTYSVQRSAHTQLGCWFWRLVWEGRGGGLKRGCCVAGCRSWRGTGCATQGGSSKDQSLRGPSRHSEGFVVWDLCGRYLGILHECCLRRDLGWNHDPE